MKETFSVHPHGICLESQDPGAGHHNTTNELHKGSVHSGVDWLFVVFYSNR